MPDARRSCSGLYPDYHGIRSSIRPFAAGCCTEFAHERLAGHPLFDYWRENWHGSRDKHGRGLFETGDSGRRISALANVPAPRRGELGRILGEELRAEREVLGKIVTIEVGKSVAEGLGEVQEMIDICDFAVGLSRQLYGLTMPSERIDHRIMEQWHPLGIVGVISAFNFPVAAWSGTPPWP